MSTRGQSNLITIVLLNYIADLFFFLRVLAAIYMTMTVWLLLLWIPYTYQPKFLWPNITLIYFSFVYFILFYNNSV